MSTRLRPDISDETRQQIASEYDAGASTSELADRYGMSRTGVGYMLRGLGVDMRPKGQNSRINEKRAMAVSSRSLADDGLRWVQHGHTMRAEPILRIHVTPEDGQAAHNAVRRGVTDPYTVALAKAWDAWRKRKMRAEAAEQDAA